MIKLEKKMPNYKLLHLVDLVILNIDSHNNRTSKELKIEFLTDK